MSFFCNVLNVILGAVTKQDVGLLRTRYHYPPALVVNKTESHVELIKAEGSLYYALEMSAQARMVSKNVSRMSSLSLRFDSADSQVS